jgi:hypothetical protein
MRLAETEMMALVDRAGMGAGIRHDGSLELYDSKLSSTSASAGWRQREQAGIAFEHVRGQRLVELQPGLSPRFVAGTFVPGWKTVSEPQAFALALWAHAQRCGANLRESRDCRSGAKWCRSRRLCQACRWHHTRRRPHRHLRRRLVDAPDQPGHHGCAFHSTPSAATTPRCPRAHSISSGN